LTLLALGESREARAVPVLRQHAEGPTKKVRTTALLSMSLSRLPAAHEYLLSLVERAPDGRALEAIAALESQRFDSALMERVKAVGTTRSDKVQARSWRWRVVGRRTFRGWRKDRRATIVLIP
jgi:hypothetical protein